jgi:hypothetical protein
LLLGATAAQADVISVNGDFSQNLTGWTTIGNVVAKDDPMLSNTGITYPVTGMSDKYAVIGYDVERGTSILEQAYEVNPGDVSISFDFFFSSFDNYNWINDAQTDYFTAYYDTTNGESIQLASFSSGIEDIYYNYFGHVETAFTASAPGTIRFALAEAADSGIPEDWTHTNSWAAIDNVMVSNVTAPEPGSMILLGSGLIGLATLRKRSNKK